MLYWHVYSCSVFAHHFFMLICNVILIVLLYKTYKKLKKMKSTSKDLSNVDQIVTLAVTLITTCFTYLVLTSPYTEYSIYYSREIYQTNKPTI